jgi:hypothetical protein
MSLMSEFGKDPKTKEKERKRQGPTHKNSNDFQIDV